MLSKIKRPSFSSLAGLGVYLLAIGIALIVNGIFINLLGMSPLTAYQFLFREGMGSVYGVTETLVKATPLLFCGLGLALAFTARFWNIGAEGQLYMGAMASSWVGLTFAGLPFPLAFLLVLVAGFAMGALWGVIPGVLKAKLQVNEVITTLLMNFIAILFIGWLVSGPWRDPTGWELWAPTLPQSLWLPKIMPRTRLHFGFLLALACIPLVYLLMQKSTFGYRIRAIGASQSASRYGGINISRNIIFVAALSGGLAGLAGVSEIFGVQYRLLTGFTGLLGFGYVAIPVAWLGRNSPLGVLIMSIFFGFLINGGEAMQRGASVPVAVSYSIMAMIMALVLIIEMLIQRRRR